MLSNILKKNTPRWLVLVIDLYIILNTFILSYIIRFNFSLEFSKVNLMYQLLVIFIVGLISFLLVGSYKGIIRHTGIKDSRIVINACLIILVLLVGLYYWNQFSLNSSKLFIPKSVIAIHFLLNIVLLISSRFLYKGFYHYLTSGVTKLKKVLIYGAGEAGVLLLGILTQARNSNIQVVGFIDDDKKKTKSKISGVKVFHAGIINQEFIFRKKIDEIILSIEHIKPSRLIEIVDELSNLSAELKIIPPVKKWIDNDLSEKQIKPVKIEDLLGRKPIELNNQVLEKEFDGQTILISGAAGSIGSEISRQLSEFKKAKLIILDQAESELYNLQQFFIGKGITNCTAIVADVRNKERLRFIIKKYKPSIVFHAAAYKHVPFMEDNPYEAVRNNVCGTKNLADLSVEFGVEKFVMVSTDKAVNPTNIMGATKRIAELYINCLNSQGVTKFITTRFGNVLGSNGSVIPLFQEQIKNGGPITVTHKDITRYFMTIPEACQLVLEAGCMGKGGEIFVFDMGKSIKILDLAKHMIRLSGLNYPKDIQIEITGLRPGEKIYEELLASGEHTIPTHHEKILKATVIELDQVTIQKGIEELCVTLQSLNYDNIVIQMKKLVQEYVSNNSKYEVLDK